MDVGAGTIKEVWVVKELGGKFFDSLYPFPVVATFGKEFVAVTDLVDCCIDGGCSFLLIFICLSAQMIAVESFM
jgi:hypothetical protein